MDGSQFKRESLGLRFERSNLGDVLDTLEAQVYYNYADHVMDNYTLRTPSGTGMMAGPMASNVDRRTLGARLKSTCRRSAERRVRKEGVSTRRSRWSQYN